VDLGQSYRAVHYSFSVFVGLIDSELKGDAGKGEHVSVHMGGEMSMYQLPAVFLLILFFHIKHQV